MSTPPLILIVEDEVVLAIDLADLFLHAGYRTAIAASAAEADEILKRSPPAAAVVDLRLRDGMTGPDIARSLHELGVPVVIHTGESSEWDGVPAVAYLVKPVPSGLMLAQVRAAIAQRKQA